MQCIECGATLPDGARACPSCGTQVAPAAADAPSQPTPLAPPEPQPVPIEPIRSVERGERPPPGVGRKLNVLGYFGSVVIWLPVAFGLLFVYGFFNHAALVPRLEAGFEQACVDGSAERGLKGSEAALRRYCDCAWDQVKPQVGRMDTAISQVSFGVVHPTLPQQPIDVCVRQLD